MRTRDMLTKFVTGILLMTTTVLIVACSSGVGDEELITSAKGYMAKNQVREAAIELKNVLQANPKNAEARYLLGEINMQIGSLAAAEKEFERALKMGWDAEAALTGKLRAMSAQKKYKEVLETADTTTGWSKTGQANFMALKALAHAGEGDLLKAKNTILLADKLDADAYNVVKTTVLLQLAEKQKMDAEETLSRALKLFPGDPELMLLSANIAILNKQLKKAVRIFERVIASGPDKMMTLHTRRAQLGLLRLAVLAKDFEQVKKSRDAFMASKVSDPEVDYYLAVAAYEENDYDQAEEYLQKILKTSSAHGPTLLLSGSVSFAKRDYEKAAYFLSKYVAGNPENIKARKMLGRAYMALGQSKDASSEFNAALTEDDDVELIALLGLSEINSGQVESGIAGLERALAMAPGNHTLKLQLAKAYIADGQTDKAIKYLDEILQTGEDYNQISSFKVQAYLKSRDIEKAIGTTRQMLARSPDDPEVLSLMGTVQVAASNLVAARKYYNQALEISPEHLGSEINLARLDEQQGDIDSAERHYLSVLDKKPQSVVVLTSLARLAERQGDTKKQIKWLQAARQADERELYSRVALIEIYLKKENIADAETILKELEEVYSNKPAILVVKGRLLMAKKRFIQAKAIISEFIDAVPEMDVGYYLLAKSQLALGEKQAALLSLQKAYSLKPDVLRNIILLASVEQSSGHYGRALKLAEEVISAAPDSAIGYVLRGDALLAMNKNRRALAEFDKAWKKTKSRDIALRRFKVIRQLSGLKKAAPVLTGWLESQPDDAMVMLALATAYSIGEDNDKAATYFEKVLMLQPENIVALNNLAWLYGLVDDPRALTLAKKAYSLQPESPGIIDTYGWVLLKNNKPAEALTLLKQAAYKLPDIAEVQYHYAKALYINGHTDAARRILRQLIASGDVFDGRKDAEKMLAE